MFATVATGTASCHQGRDFGNQRRRQWEAFDWLRSRANRLTRPNRCP